MTIALPLCALPASELIGVADGPVVVAIGGISATHHVASHADNSAPGWWEPFVGTDLPLDPARCRVLGFDFITSSTGPTTTHDQAHALAQVLEEREIAAVHAIVGSSYGGMIALAFAELYPERVSRLVLISAPHESHPMTTAIRVVQRRILRLGLETGRHAECVALARALGITTYRTAEEFADRFDVHPVAADGALRFPVEEYLDKSGERFAAAFPIERYLALSESLDLHRVDPSRISLPVTIVASASDTLVPMWQLRELASRLAGPTSFHVVRSVFGHDAFLKEVEQVSAIVTEAIALGGRHAA